MNHRVTRLIFAFSVGFLSAYFAFSWISNPAPRAERQLEESVVITARGLLQNLVGVSDIQIVDPLATNRAVGKSYVYRAEEGWEVSGFYRRGEGDRWHPFLLVLNSELTVSNLRVQDAALQPLIQKDSRIEVLP